ncbi:HAD-like domain-containing protein [Neohortaea acidophila]|uniref:HAD-like domain-containing protein n=1 Tax=Neohortaea acidophila TaxID=245834 RepID=A0A6A6PTR7_9PEZI|nr:HAD-like domain-containing protein [Neohortaea acidophila]KAF2483081.1 HAD-like domain-containing protein [Neohortaea acidophila]
MDGLLIDSEDKYTICTNEVLREYGRPGVPWNIKAQLQGRPAPQAGGIFWEWAKLPLSREEFYTKVQALQKTHFPTCKPLAGVPELLRILGKQTDVKIALATSSQTMNFKLKTGHLEELFAVFADENRVLGDDERIGKGRGKPAPDIYLVALETINARLRKEGGKEITPAECLVFEDSVPGVESGRRAGMQVVWCPHPGLLNEYKGREAEVLAGLTGEHKEVQEKNEEIGVVAADGSERKKGAPGELNDGWAKFLPSLEDFPYQDYGINIRKEDGRL